VVNGSPRVSPEVRREVEAAIERLGYVPNRAARSLVTRRSGSFGLVITEPTGRVFTDPFFPRVLRGISAELTARDQHLILLVPNSTAELQRTGDYLSAGHVDGVVFVSLHGEDPLPGRLEAAGVPMVLVGRPLRGISASYVDVDNRQGARSAVAHLVAAGRQEIATIAGPQDMPAGIDRLVGYRDAVGEAFRATDPSLEAIGDFSQESGAKAMTQLLARRPNLDAVFAASDLMAAGALSALTAAGRRVPQDVALVGYDDSPVATSTHPPLSSVRQPIEEMGREVARLLVEAVEGTDRVHRRVILATELVKRASSAGRHSP
jgi:DNA-binding LacI/PurR family transcriptional regulator